VVAHSKSRGEEGVGIYPGVVLHHEGGGKREKQTGKGEEEKAHFYGSKKGGGNEEEDRERLLLLQLADMKDRSRGKKQRSAEPAVSFLRDEREIKNTREMKERENFH